MLTPDKELRLTSVSKKLFLKVSYFFTFNHNKPERISRYLNWDN